MHGDTMTLTRTAEKAVYQLRHGGTLRFPGKGFSDRDFPSEELGVLYKYPTDMFRPVSDTKNVRAFEMNACMVLLTVGLLLAAVSAVPVADLQDIKPMGDESQEALFAEAIQQQVSEERGLRFRRVTCDLLSVSIPIGSLNHSACAAHCLSKRKGFKGGRCKDGVCHCRK